MIPIELVIDQTARAIQQRAKTVIIPKVNTFVGRAPGLARPLIDRIGCPGHRIPRAIELASRTGLHNVRTHQRDRP
ncbi:MAG: hypothetical protein ACLP0J_10760 [Solirubrobacteraceae bacterium]